MISSTCNVFRMRDLAEFDHELNFGRQKFQGDLNQNPLDLGNSLCPEYYPPFQDMFEDKTVFF